MIWVTRAAHTFVIAGGSGPGNSGRSFGADALPIRSRTATEYRAATTGDLARSRSIGADAWCLRHGRRVCCPSRWPEPLGTVNVEAMAAGKPVVASRVGGIPEVVEDGITGFLVPPVDRKALTSALSRLLNDEDLRRRMGGAARRRSVEFGWAPGRAQSGRDL